MPPSGRHMWRWRRDPEHCPRPVWHLKNSAIRPASTHWIILLCLQIVSIVLSAYSTFRPIIETRKFSSFKQQKQVGLLDYVFQVLLVVIHLVFATGVVYLQRVNNYSP